MWWNGARTRFRGLRLANMPINWQNLRGHSNVLGPRSTSVFTTALHPDHTGLAQRSFLQLRRPVSPLRARHPTPSATKPLRNAKYNGGFGKRLATTPVASLSVRTTSANHPARAVRSSARSELCYRGCSVLVPMVKQHTVVVLSGRHPPHRTSIKSWPAALCGSRRFKKRKEIRSARDDLRTLGDRSCEWARASATTSFSPRLLRRASTYLRTQQLP